MTSRAAVSNVRGKVVAITGGARGIGYSTASRLIAGGAIVAIGDVDETRLKEAVGELGITSYRHLDVTDPESFSRFLDQVEKQHGPLDVLINNAGIMPLGATGDEADAVSRRIVEINLLGVIYGTKLALQRMLPRRSGHIVNISSLAGESYVPGGATYCATKHAVKAYTETARREYRGSGVAISQVMPFFTNTELVAGTAGTKGMRNAEPDEVAAAIVGLIARPRGRVRVPRLAGAMTASQAFLPSRVAESISRWLGAGDTFAAGIDPVARRTYEERARSV